MLTVSEFDLFFHTKIKYTWFEMFIRHSFYWFLFLSCFNNILYGNLALNHSIWVWILHRLLVLIKLVLDEGRLVCKFLTLFLWLNRALILVGWWLIMLGDLMLITILIEYFFWGMITVHLLLIHFLSLGTRPPSHLFWFGSVLTLIWRISSTCHETVLPTVQLGVCHWFRWVFPFFIILHSCRCLSLPRLFPWIDELSLTLYLLRLSETMMLFLHIIKCMHMRDGRIMVIRHQTFQPSLQIPLHLRSHFKLLMLVREYPIIQHLLLFNWVQFRYWYRSYNTSFLPFLIHELVCCWVHFHLFLIHLSRLKTFSCIIFSLLLALPTVCLHRVFSLFGWFDATEYFIDHLHIGLAKERAFLGWVGHIRSLCLDLLLLPSRFVLNIFFLEQNTLWSLLWSWNYCFWGILSYKLVVVIGHLGWGLDLWLGCFSLSDPMWVAFPLSTHGSLMFTTILFLTSNTGPLSWGSLSWGVMTVLLL